MERVASPVSAGDAPVLPAGRWRVGASVLIDYQAFALLWAALAPFLTPERPAPGWVAALFFLWLWRAAAPHWWTPGMRAMSVVRVVVPVERGHPRVQWLTDPELTAHENSLSVATGLAFLLLGLGALAHGAAAFAGLSTDFLDLRGMADVVLAALWGGLCLAAGAAFLRLTRPAPYLGLVTLGVAMGSLMLAPAWWGARLAAAFALAGAFVGARLSQGDAVWLQVWLPAAAWVVCAVWALAIALNRRPFPAASSRIPPAPPRPREHPASTDAAPPRRDDMPVARAAQGTALIMLCVLLLGSGVTAWCRAWGDRQDRDSRLLAETAVRRAAAAWDPEALAAIANANLQAALRRPAGREAFARYARLGALSRMDPPEGEAVVRLSPDGPDLSADYQADVVFANGTAHIGVALLRDHEGRWTVAGLQVRSPLVEPRR